MKIKLLIILTLTLAIKIAIGQTVSPIGTWKLIKHITTYNKDKNYDCVKLLAGSTEITQFNKDGSYTEINKDIKGKVLSTAFGFWKISADNKKLTLYKNDFKPNPLKATCSDRILDVIKLTTTELEIKEIMCTEDFEGISSYKRTK